MAKTKISEFSTTAGNNTDINSINIAEGCSPSGINDAIRELMRQLKEFQTGGAGDSVNSGGDFSVATNKFTVASASGNTSVAGTLGVTGTTTLTGALVANGNATLGDASGDTVTIKGTPTLEVNPTLSGGTANGVLYLNGSKVATSGSALTYNGTGLGVGVSSASFTLDVGGADGTNIALRSTGTTSAKFRAYVNGAESGVIGFLNGGGQYFEVAGSEAMRLTSTGLGIGTSSPGAKLAVVGSGGTFASTIYGTSTSADMGLSLYSENNSGTPSVRFLNGLNSHRIWLSGDGSGDLNFGSGWSTTTPLLKLTGSGNLGLGVQPSAWGTAKAFQIGGSGFALSSNGAGSGDGSLNWNGYYNGTNWIYSYTGGVATRYRQNEAGHAWFTAPSGTAGNAITFTQAMTLTAGGNLLVGTTSGNGLKIDFSPTSSQQNGITYVISSPDSYTDIYGCGTSGGWNGAIRFFTSSSAAATERARIDSSGNLLVGTTSDGAGIGFPNRLAVDGGASEASIFKTSAGTSAYCSRMWNSATSGNNLFIDFQTEAGGTDRGSITYNRAGGLVAYNTTSDYRAKDITGPVADSGAVIDSVPVYMGKMKGATQERPMFIAHETPAYAHTGEKDAVDSEGNPVYQQMDASALIPVMWAEIQSLRARVAALES